MINRFAMVADGERLVFDSYMLYCSIKYHMPDAHVIIGVPEDNIKPLNVFDNTDVEKISLPKPLLKEDGKYYRFSNKVNLMASIGNDPAFLCDSDMVMIRPLPMNYFKNITMAAVPDDRLSWNGDWEMIYNMFDLPLPTERVLTTLTRELSFPYYNAGFIYSATPNTFGTKWLEFTSKIVATPNIPRKYPFSDQIALPVAAAAIGETIHRLDDCFNHAVVKPFQKYAYMVHHHDLYDQLISNHRKSLNNIIEQFPRFDRVLEVLANVHQREKIPLRPPMKGRDDLL